MPGYNETLNKKLIPVSSTHKIYDFTAVGFGVVQMYGLASNTVELNTSPFAISVQDDGTIFISQPYGTESLNPPDNGTQTILTISQYRTYTIVKGTLVISPQKTGVLLKAKGSNILVDSVPPVITAITPSGGSVSVSTTITLTFSESIQKGTGNIVLWNETTNTQIEAINVVTAPTSGAGSISYFLNQIIITPTTNLPNGVVVSVRPSAGSLKDLPNNPIAAVVDNAWSFSTVVASAPSNFVPDVVVSSVASLTATLTSWQNNPNGTIPNGKAALDDRVLGYDTSLGNITLNGYNLPMKVYIRPVGTFSTTVLFGVNQPSCSTFINGTIVMNNCNNIVFWRNDIRAPTNAAYNSGFITMTSCTNSGLIKNVLRGFPHQLVPGTYGTTARGVKCNGGSNLIFENNVTLYAYDAQVYFDNTVNNLVYRGNMGRHSGANMITLDGTNFILNDGLFEYNYLDRAFHPYKALHGDWFQYNSAGASNRMTWRYNVCYHGHWTGEYNPDTNGNITNAPQFLFCSQGSNTSTGPNLFENNLVVNPQQRGVDRIPGTAILTTQFNTMLDPVVPSSPIIQGSPAPYPRIVSTDISSRNFITAPASNPSYQVNEGTGGVRKVVGTAHTEILDEHMAIPTDLTDLWDIRPRVGTITHPDYTPANNRVGCFDLWAKLFNKDPKALLSMTGWPCATIFIEDFDPLNRFGSTYTGVYDSNGENA